MQSPQTTSIGYGFAVLVSSGLKRREKRAGIFGEWVGRFEPVKFGRSGRFVSFLTTEKHSKSKKL